MSGIINFKAKEYASYNCEVWNAGLGIQTDEKSLELAYLSGALEALKLAMKLVQEDELSGRELMDKLSNEWYNIMAE